MEHNKQNDRYSREFFPEGIALVNNNSYGRDGIAGGREGGGGIGASSNIIFNNGTDWNDINRHISKKVH